MKVKEIEEEIRKIKEFHFKKIEDTKCKNNINPNISQSIERTKGSIEISIQQFGTENKHLKGFIEDIKDEETKSEYIEHIEGLNIILGEMTDRVAEMFIRDKESNHITFSCKDCMYISLLDDLSVLYDVQMEDLVYRIFGSNDIEREKLLAILEKIRWKAEYGSMHYFREIFRYLEGLLNNNCFFARKTPDDGYSY